METLFRKVIERVTVVTRRNPLQGVPMPTAKPVPGSQLLTPKDHALVMIDLQSLMAFATRSVDAILLRSNTGLIAAGCRAGR